MFIDLKKLYDTVPVKSYGVCCEETNINYTEIKALKNLYDGSTSRIKIGNRLSQKFPINKGLRQAADIV